MAAQRLVRRLPVGESVVDAILGVGALGASGTGRRRGRQADRLGTEPAGEPVADARGTRSGATRWPSRAVDR